MNDEDLVMLAQHNTLNLPWKCAVETPQRNIKVFCIEEEAEEDVVPSAVVQRLLSPYNI